MPRRTEAQTASVPDALAGPRRRLDVVPETPYRAVIYCRQSLKKEESISLPLQETVNRDYCARQGYTVAAVITDQKTGQEWEKRKGVQRVMQMVLAGEADRVILYRWSRISRVRLHQAQAIHAIEQAGAEIESATEPFDTRTAAGEFGRDQMLGFAVFQGKLIGEQWTEAHERRRNNGLPHAGGRRWGYRQVNRDYVVDEALADIDRWRYAEYIAGRGFPSLATELNRRGIGNAYGRPWNTEGLSKSMDSGFSAGLLVTNTGRGRGNTKWLAASHPAVIDADTWAAYRRARFQRHTMPPRTVEPVYPLTGLMFCADCGYSMYPATHQGQSGFDYVCGRYRSTGLGRSVRTRRARVEQAVLAWLADIAEDVETSSRAARAGERIRLRAHVDATIAAREVGDIDKQLTTLTRQLAREVIPESVYITARDELMTERAQAQKALDLAIAGADVPARPPRDVAVNLVENWDILSVRVRRTLLAQLVRGVLVMPSPGPPRPSPVLIVPTWYD
jgi:DNA invertase Pin-like site-specific DNA recombinase